LATERRLVLASALMLFLELALIRWLGANVVHLSYFTNFVLLGSFLGIGLGFLLARTEHSALRWSPLVLASLVALVLLVPVRINRASDQIIYFTATDPTGPPAWVTLPLIFAAVAAALLGPAEVVGRCFAKMAALDAYRLDLVGSLTGIAAFTALSFLRSPSFVWGALVAAAFLLLLRPRIPVLSAGAALAMVGLLVFESAGAGVSWSPYYKVVTDEVPGFNNTAQLRISVNGVPHQVMRSAALRLKEEPQYGLPYDRFAGHRLGRVLIVGAGSGSDVAIALAKGAQHVDAVEIDPRILQIGEQRHPDHPYQDPRVSTYVNDGRAFLQQSHAKYDLILFALPDSLVLVSGASSIRLESYLFTKEAVESARNHLAPGGGFSMYNYYREDRLIDRLGGTVADVFGHDPCVDRVGTGGGQAVISAGLTTGDQSCAPNQAPLPATRAAPATDDRPFVYFFGSSLPKLYLLSLGGILLVSLICVRALSGPFRTMRPYADLFFMGAAFLLLETKNVASFALLFGTTWVVNAIVFAGVLVAVLLAVETTRRVRTPPLPVVYSLIAAALAVAFAVPNSALLALPLTARLVAAVALAFAPIYLANVAFAKRFAQCDDSRAAFAVNVLGAMVGGCLEYLSLLTGYRNLLILAGVLYLAAFVLAPKRLAVRA
jgi:Spermine/spermidine synthase domain